MNQSEKLLGILTRLNKKENEGSTYFTAWVETPNSSDKFFHQNSLTNRKEIDNIAEGALVLFEVKTTKTKIGEREDAFNCSLNCEKIILKDIIQYDLLTIKFIFKYATEELKTKLISKIETIQAKSPINEVLTKLESIRKELPKFFEATKNQGAEIEQEIQQNLHVIEKVAPKSFLEIIFETNTPEYNQNLFHILVDGLKTIYNEDVFQQAKFLLKFNATTNIKLENLNSIFYHKATDEYKFRLWFEKLTDYCSTEILKFHFEKSQLGFKSEIIQRCQGSENGFLVLNNQVKNSNEVEEVYFSGIREKLLQELNEAEKSIFVAVAWFTNDDLFGILCMKLKRGVKVELIIINDYINNWEFGLPFQTFVDLGGKLYLSEYPSIMHHKFCLIDDETIFNGSYNWTYYAEMRNYENIMLFKGKPNLVKEFKTEFKKLKSKLGNPIVKVVPFDSSQIERFERTAFRQYFSTDLTLRAETIRKTNITRANELTNTAINIDKENTEAKSFQKEIQPEVLLQQRTIQVQNIVADKTETIIEQLEEVEKTQNYLHNPVEKNLPIFENKVIKLPQTDDIKVDIMPLADKENEFTQISQDETTEISTKPFVNAQQTPKQETQKVVITQKEVKQEPIKQVITPQIQNTLRVTPSYTNTTPIQVQKTAPVIVENFSVPKSEVKKHLYENLQLVIALDYSSSMDTRKILLYSSGKIQKAINLIFAISQGLTSEQNIDMFLFEIKSIRLPSVTKGNYLTYVAKEIIEKHQMNGTNIFAPIEDINKNYTGASKNVFVVLITDGENNIESNKKIIEYFKTNNNTSIFWQFVGLGAKFDFLESLEQIATNVAFFALNDVQSISNETLLERLLQKFPTWYKECQTKPLIKQ
jgi:hypothetical protein